MPRFGKGRLQFGGGSLLNWVYARSSPRFSFDVDSQITQAALSKKEILSNLITEINDRLRQIGKIVPVHFAGKRMEIGSIVYDREKDHFPGILSLKRPVFCHTTGTEAHKYLRRELEIRTDTSKESMKLKEKFGGKYPRIDDVRVEIGIPSSKNDRFPHSRVKVQPLVAPEVKVKPVEASVTVREFTMGLKIFKLGKEFTKVEEGFALQDFVKSICDIWACSSTYGKESLTEYFKQVCFQKNADPEKVRNGAIRRLTKLQEDNRATKWFETSGQTSFIARSHDSTEISAITKKVICNMGI